LEAKAAVEGCGNAGGAERVVKDPARLFMQLAARGLAISGGHFGATAGTK
jgi:hypothetical protein